MAVWEDLMRWHVSGSSLTLWVSYRGPVKRQAGKGQVSWRQASRMRPTNEHSSHPDHLATTRCNPEPSWGAPRASRHSYHLMEKQSSEKNRISCLSGAERIHPQPRLRGPFTYFERLTRKELHTNCDEGTTKAKVRTWPRENLNKPITNRIRGARDSRARESGQDLLPMQNPSNLTWLTWSNRFARLSPRSKKWLSCRARARCPSFNGKEEELFLNFNGSTCIGFV